MNTDALLENSPRPAPVTERLKDFCAELAQRAGEPVTLLIVLDRPAWDAVRNDFQRPSKPRPKTFMMSGPGYSIWFEQGDAATAAYEVEQVALDLPKPWPACPGCSQSVTSAVPMPSPSERYRAHPCGCVVLWPLVAKVIRVSGASA